MPRHRAGTTTAGRGSGSAAQHGTQPDPHPAFPEPVQATSAGGLSGNVRYSGGSAPSPSRTTPVIAILADKIDDIERRNAASRSSPARFEPVRAISMGGFENTTRRDRTYSPSAVPPEPVKSTSGGGIERPGQDGSVGTSRPTLEAARAALAGRFEGGGRQDRGSDPRLAQVQPVQAISVGRIF
jgi:hypothetical protein